MASTSPFKSFMNNFFFIFSLAIGGIFITKTIVSNNREKSFQPEYIENGNGGNGGNEGTNIAKIKPGFAKSTGEYQRKSEYEGAGLSYQSRKKGDRLTTWSYFKGLFGSEDDK